MAQLSTGLDTRARRAPRSDYASAATRASAAPIAIATTTQADTTTARTRRRPDSVPRLTATRSRLHLSAFAMSARRPASPLPGPQITTCPAAFPPVAAAPPQATQRPAWAGPSRFTWQVEEADSGAKRRSPLPRKPRRRAKETPEAGRRPVALMVETHGTKQMERNRWRETGPRPTRRDTPTLAPVTTSKPDTQNCSTPPTPRAHNAAHSKCLSLPTPPASSRIASTLQSVGLPTSRSPRTAPSDPVAATPAPALKHPAWAGPSRFTWRVEEGGSSAKRWTPLPPKPSREAEDGRHAGWRPVRP